MVGGKSAAPLLQVEMFTDAYAAAKGSHALCVLTEWDEFKQLDYERIYNEMVKYSSASGLSARWQAQNTCCRVVQHDRLTCSSLAGSQASYLQNLVACCQTTDCVSGATQVKPAFVFDGRNILDHEKLRDIGFIVYALGKPLDPFLHKSII